MHDLSARERHVRDQVHHSIAADPGVDAQGVSVEIDHDHVILHGSVPSATIALRIAELAAGTPGVLHVDNRLTVRGRFA